MRRVFLFGAGLAAAALAACGDERAPAYQDPVETSGDGDGDEFVPPITGDGDGISTTDTGGSSSGGNSKGGDGGSSEGGDGNGGGNTTPETGGAAMGGAPASGGSTSTGTEALFLFRGPWLPHGDSAGREGLDVLCRQSAPDSLSSKTIHAFVSVTADDEIRDMPARYGVPTDEAIYAPDGTLLSADWGTLLSADVPWSGCMHHDHPLDSLFSDVSNREYVTGSDRYGALAANCEGWTDDGGVLVIGGSLSFADGIFDATDCTVLAPKSSLCDFTGDEPYVLCVAY